MEKESKKINFDTSFDFLESYESSNSVMFNLATLQLSYNSLLEFRITDFCFKKTMDFYLNDIKYSLKLGSAIDEHTKNDLLSYISSFIDNFKSFLPKFFVDFISKNKAIIASKQNELSKIISFLEEAINIYDSMKIEKLFINQYLENINSDNDIEFLFFLSREFFSILLYKCKFDISHLRTHVSRILLQNNSVFDIDTFANNTSYIFFKSVSDSLDIGDNRIKNSFDSLNISLISWKEIKENKTKMNTQIVISL